MITANQSTLKDSAITPIAFSFARENRNSTAKRRRGGKDVEISSWHIFLRALVADEGMLNVNQIPISVV